MIAFLDTETSGLPDINKRASDPSQPHIVQLACILTTDLGQVVDSYSFVVKPEGWTIPKEVSDIHGITTEVAADIGVPEKQVLETFLESLTQAQLLVAHQVTFDKFICRIGLRRHGLFDDDKDAWWKAFPTFCTMRKMTDVCRLPNPTGRSGFKWPRLTEAYMHAFGTPLAGAHDALADVKACKEIYFWMLQRGGGK